MRCLSLSVMALLPRHSARAAWVTRGRAGAERAVGPQAGQQRVPLVPRERERSPAGSGPTTASLSWCGQGRVLHAPRPASASALLPNHSVGRKSKGCAGAASAEPQPGLGALSRSRRWQPCLALLLSPITRSHCPSWLRALPARH